jgi:hypothetical protein
VGDADGGAGRPDGGDPAEPASAFEDLALIGVAVFSMATARYW